MNLFYKTFIISLISLTGIIISFLTFFPLPKFLKFRTDNTITIDCSKSVVVKHSMSGLLLSINQKKPSLQLIKDINPAYWRNSSLNNQVRLKMDSINAKQIFIISDVYQYPGSKKNWKSPKDDPKSWEDAVMKTVQYHQKFKQNVIYDIWNEPNVKFFWNESDHDLFDTFKLASQKIRSMPGGDKIQLSGPSISKLDTTYLRKFLNYCLSNDIRLDILSWHEFRTGNDISNIEEDINWVRTNFLNHPKYDPLQIKSLQINEIVGKADQFNPAVILSYFYYLEKSGVDAACKACWDEPSGVNNCFNNSLDGLLDPKNHETRAAYWAYKFYNQSLNSRLSSTANNKNIVSFANFQNNKIQLLIGYAGEKIGNTSATIELNNISKLKINTKNSQLNYRIFEVPNTGESVVLAPQLISTSQCKIINDKADVSFPEIKLGSIYRIELFK